jgi:hypothetical protein
VARIVDDDCIIDVRRSRSLSDGEVSDATGLVEPSCPVNIGDTEFAHGFENTSLAACLHLKKVFGWGIVSPRTCWPTGPRSPRSGRDATTPDISQVGVTLCRSGPWRRKDATRARRVEPEGRDAQ